MSLTGKLQGDVEIKASADKFHDVFSCRPHHVSNATPHNVQSCEIHEGEFGKEGSVIYWNYVHDGIPKVAKQKVEAIDDVNLSTTFTFVEGDIFKEYKNFKATVKVIPKGEGSVVHWTLEYEKLHKDIPEPDSLLEFCKDISKDIDAHLTKA